MRSMATEPHGTRGMMYECWRQLLTGGLRETPDARLEVYKSIASFAGDGCGGLLSHMWTMAMLRAAQDPWSRIRKLGRENLLREVAATGNESLTVRYDRCLLCLVLDRWSQLKYWYEREGVLLLITGLISCTPHLKSESGMLAYLLLRVVLPSLSDPQVPVREVAVEVAFQVARMNRELASYTLDYVLTTLAACVEGTTESEPTRVEGFLSCLTKLLTMDEESFFTRHLWLRMRPVLEALAIHSAASVRQRVAGIWALRSAEMFAVLCGMVIQKAAETRSECDRWWRMTESLLMALQDLLQQYLCLPEEATVLGVEMHALVANSLYAVLVCAEAKQFEVARVGKQVLSLLTQFWVRFAPSLGFLEDCCGPSAVRFRECAHFSTHFLPNLVWLLALRRYLRPPSEEEDLRGAVARHVVSLLAGPWCGRSGAPFQQPGCSLAVLLVCTYFPECCSGSSCGVEMIDFALSEAVWDRALSEDANNARYAVDFTFALRRGGGSSLHLVPQWLRRLPGAHAHQQCLILHAVKVAIAPTKFLDVLRPFSFAYHSVFEAPTMQDGGEDVALGFSWLRQCFPTHVSLPEMAPLPVGSGSGASGADIPTTAAVAAAVAVALHGTVYGKMYLSRGVEPCVLHAVRSLMALECEADPQHETIGAVVEAVVARLDRVVPGWGETLPVLIAAAAGGGGGAPDGMQKGKTATGWDDSSGSDAEDTEGITPLEEIREAGRLLAAAFRGHTAGEKTQLLRALCPAGRQEGIRLLCETRL